MRSVITHLLKGPLRADRKILPYLVDGGLGLDVDACATDSSAKINLNI